MSLFQHFEHPTLESGVGIAPWVFSDDALVPALFRHEDFVSWRGFCAACFGSEEQNEH